MGKDVQGDPGVSRTSHGVLLFPPSKKADRSLPCLSPLKAQHFKTAYGELLDLQEGVVGDFFDDRSADGNIRNSFLEVHRFPPAPDDLEILQRFPSLAPTSSVRPRKRPLELPSQSYPSPSHSSRRIHREIPSIEGRDAEVVPSFEPTKRQRTHESRLNAPFAGHPESAIPDSPLARASTSARRTFAGGLPLGRESTRSESPELGASFHEVSAAGSNDAPPGQPVTSAIPPESEPHPEANSQDVEKVDMARAEETAQALRVRASKAKRAKARAKFKTKMKAGGKAKADAEAEAKAKAKAEAEATRERELAETKRMELTMVSEARISETNKTSERLAREQRAKEVSLAEEAHKAMLEADGAKQIEAEREKKEKSRHEELVAKKQANQADTEGKAKEAQAKAYERKAREEKRARDKAQKLVDSECKHASEPILPPRTATETATAVKEQAQQRIAEKEAQKLRSSSDVQSQRSMTPRMPGSSVGKSSSLVTSLRSTPAGNPSPGNTDAPLRSALRRTPSSLHRSISSVSFDVAQAANLNTRNAPTSNPKSLNEINHEAAAKTPSATSVITGPPGNTSKPPSKTPTQTPVHNKASGRKITKTPVKNGKVQTKLNVTREPKKLKGRAIVPPVKSPPVKSTQAAPQQAIVIEDSSASEGPRWQTGNAEAGPSSRKPMLPVVSQPTKPAEVQVLVTPPRTRNKTQVHSTVAPAALPRRNSTLDTAPMPKSTSQSPAQILSETISISSDSEKELHAPTSKVPSATKGVTRVPGTFKKLSKDVYEVVKQPEDHLTGKAPPQSVTQVPPSQSRRIMPAKVRDEHINRAADRQLQLESQGSIPDSRVNMASSIPSDAPGDTIINQGLDHAGRLPNGIRPAYNDYPKFSELQKLPRTVTAEAQKTMNFTSSQLVSDPPVSSFELESSSSDGDDRDSNSDQDEDIDRCPPQRGSPKPYPGVKKLAKRR